MKNPFKLIIPLTALMLATGIGIADKSNPPPEPDPAPEAGVTYIIPIEGPIEKALLYVVRRGLAQAAGDKAAAVVFVMDTPGGRLDAADEMVRLLLGTDIPTYTLVKSRALSAGAIIAMATDRIYMAPGSVIGDAMPIMVSPFGGVQEMPEAMQEKAVSAVSAMIRSAAQQKGHDPQLGEAMVRREIEYKIGDTIISPAGQLLTLTDTEAAQVFGEDQKPLLSQGTVSDTAELLKLQGRSPDNVIKLEITSAEKIARIIESFSVILLAAGLLGLYIEFKTPGFGLPGIAGIICLAIFFWGHHIAGLAGMGEILIFMLGLTLLLVEVLFIPGFGLIGITGIMLVLFAFFSAMAPQFDEVTTFQTFNLKILYTPMLKAAGALVLCGLGAWLIGLRLPQSSLLRHVMLETATDRDRGFTSNEDNRHLMGLNGKALTQLRPSGAAVFGEKRLDVVTRGEFLPVGAQLKIVEAHGARIIVEELNS